jgi:anthranilate synthase component II
MHPRLLVIDNYDSFTYNLVQMFRCYDLTVIVHRADAVTIEQVDALKPDYILISPGPRDPEHAGISKRLIAHCFMYIPILGVCLGMQCINEVFQGVTVRAPIPMHGKISRVNHEATGLFAGVPSPFSVARYHSLAVRIADGGPLKLTAESEDGVVMGLSHCRWPLHGVQFHPESFMTEHGFKIIENFMNIGLPFQEKIQ